jgi:hypothetical protein
MVSLVTDLRQRAAEHLEWARTARSVYERRLFVQMAEAWLDAARQAEEALRDTDRSVDRDRGNHREPSLA